MHLRWLAWADVPLPLWSRWSGIVIAGAGFALLHWAQVVLGWNWSDEPLVLQGQRLVTWGPYRIVRHPIYAAFFLILGSTFCISANWMVGLLWLLMLSFEVRWRVLTEESLLLEKFGAPYQAYMARTGLLFPRPFPRKANQ
jgi:protein-S-isoprenylcysteine O-methyltransferase Ste14